MKKYRSIICLLLVTLFIIGSWIPTNALDVIGHIVPSDIIAYIDGCIIPSYNFENRLVVLVRDLSGYGFKVEYNDYTRTAYVTREYGITPFEYSEVSTDTNDQFNYDVLSTDITVLLDGQVVPSFNVDGRMAIYFSDLQIYGECWYNEYTRTSHITVSSKYASQSNASKNSDSTGASSVKISNNTSTGDPKSARYILNKNTKKFHLPGCSSVKQMSEKNKWYFDGTRKEAIAKGYVPCKRCNP